MAHDEHGHTAGATRVRLAVALGITAAVLVAQLVGAWISGSLALLADSGEVATDGIGLTVALIAASVASRPATDRYTFGFRRVEVLGALFNGVLLVVLVVVILIEAVERLIALAQGAESGLAPLPMLVVAVIGLAANIAAFSILRGGDRDSIGLRAAMLDAAGDLIGSVAAIIAGVIALATGFLAADAIASLVIAAIILPRAAVLLRDVARVLTESAPPETSVALIREHLLETEGVLAVHDVHAWTITSGAPVFTAHVVVKPGVLESGGAEGLLDRLGECLQGHFDVEHSTFQLEPADHQDHEEHAHR